MDTNALIQNLLELMDKSGLPEDRKKYWLERLGGDENNPDDEVKFAAELEAHLKTLDTAIEFTEAQIAADQAKIEEMDREALPYLQRALADQPAYYAQASAKYKNNVLAAEKQMMIDVEGVRGQSQSDEIDAIRKKLLS